MFLGLSLSLTTPRPASGAAFDPAALSLAVWNRGSFTAAPWAGTASAGGSGAVSLQDIFATVPTAGAAVDGFTPMANSGSQYLYAPECNAVWGASAGSIIVLAKPTAASANAAATVSNPGIVAVNGEGQFQMGFSTSGLRVSVYDPIATAYVEAPAIAAAHGSWHAFAARYTASAVQASVNGSLFASASEACNPPTLSASRIKVGSNFSTSGMVGDTMEVILCNFAVSDAQVAQVISYFKTRYPSAGLP